MLNLAVEKNVALAPLWTTEDARRLLEACKALLPSGLAGQIDESYRSFQKMFENEHGASELDPVAERIWKCFADFEETDLSDQHLHELDYVMRMDYAYCYLLIGVLPNQKEPEEISLPHLAKAAAQYEDIERRFADRPIPYFRHGNVFYQLGNYEDAVAKHKQALARLDNGRETPLAHSTLTRLRKTILRQIGAFRWLQAQLLRRSPEGSPASEEYRAQVEETFSCTLQAYETRDDRSTENDEFTQLENQRIANNLLYFSVMMSEQREDIAVLEAIGINRSRFAEWLKRIGADRVEQLTEAGIVDTIRMVQRFLGDRPKECDAAIRVIQLLAATGIGERPARREEIDQLRGAIESLTRSPVSDHSRGTPQLGMSVEQLAPQIIADQVSPIADS